MRTSLLCALLLGTLHSSPATAASISIVTRSAVTGSVVTNSDQAKSTPTEHAVTSLSAITATDSPALSAPSDEKGSNPPITFDQILDEASGITINSAEGIQKFISRYVSGDLNGQTWQFEMSHYANQGLVYKLTNNKDSSDTYTAAWGPGFLPGVLPGSKEKSSDAPDKMPADDSRYKAIQLESPKDSSVSKKSVTLAGASFALCPFHASTSLSKACAEPDSVRDGWFESSPVNLLSPTQDAFSSGAYEEWVITDLNLAGYDWRLLSTVIPNVGKDGGNDEGTKLSVSANDLASVQTPEPATTVPVLIGLAVLARRVQRRG